MINLCEVEVYAPVQEEENVALGKRSTQSSTDHGGVASRGNDGNPDPVYGNGSCFHTAWEMKPWWRVDLYARHNISSVVVTNRQAGWQSINGAEIRIGNYLKDNGNSNPLCAQIPSIPAGKTVTYHCHGMEGRYVTISINKNISIHLCEVEIYAPVAHEDVDECAENACGAYSECYNTPGSYYCICLDGYIASSGLTWEDGVTVCTRPVT
ncbi:fucolectin-like [Conger conger]|uniref:fucolectin-like n=1 Tax=Conger conger TaxID=82655 RepID=UPI002A59F143|nr:fucolectin-like [Conger conger]